MAFNSLAGSFQPLSTFAAPPAIREPVMDYPANQTAAQLTALGFTGVSVSTSGATVQGATSRKTFYLANPSDNTVPITIGNISSSATGGIGAVLPTPPVTPANQTFTPTSNGFAIPPGGIIGFGAGFNDPVYAVTAVGTASIYYIQT